MPDRPRRAPLVAGGLVAVAIGLGVGGGLWFAAGQRFDDAVAGLARATVGCETVLDFDTRGEDIVFIETRGRIDDVRGNCNVADEFEWGGPDDDSPSATLTLTDPDGDEIALSRRNGVSYDADGFGGRSVRSVSIDQGGDHTLRVESADDGFAVAVGRDPNAGVGGIRLGAALAGLIGAIGGTVLVLLGLRRGRSPVAATWQWESPPSGGGGWPSSPPGFPAPPPTTGTSAAVGPASLPLARPPTAPLPSPPSRRGEPPSAPTPSAASSAPTAGRWGPPTSHDR